jgi:hypothetical protein
MDIDANGWGTFEPLAGRSMPVEIKQGYLFALPAQVSGKVGRYGAFAHAAFLAGNQNFEFSHAGS